MVKIVSPLIKTLKELKGAKILGAYEDYSYMQLCLSKNGKTMVLEIYPDDRNRTTLTELIVNLWEV